MQEQLVLEQIQIEKNLELVDEFLSDLHDAELLLNPNTALWKNIRKDYLQHMIECEKEADGKFFVARYNNLPVGFIFGFIEEKDNSNFEIGDGDDLYISEGYVKPAFRNKGIYSKLNDTFVESYSKNKLRRVIRYTLVNNIQMQNWLKQKGFSAVRLVYEKWL